MKYGTEIRKNNNAIEVRRITKECEIVVKIKEIEGKEEVKENTKKINTGINFLNHMIETLSFRSGFDINITVNIKEISLAHVIAEDSGIVIGKAFLEIFKEKIKDGIQGNGFFNAIIDEASSIVAISVEGRPGVFFDKTCEGIEKEKVEDISSCDLKNFILGLSLGMASTIHINCISGEDPHHAWESVFRAIGECIGKCFEKNEKRMNRIVGIKGTLE